MKFIIHRGSNRIGGSCVEVFTKTTRVVLDVGKLLDDTEEDFLPVVPGLFSGGPKIDAVLLTHAHSDHCGLLDRIQTDIPVYLSLGAAKSLWLASAFAGVPSLTRDRERIVESGRTFEIGDIRITPYSVDHSTVDCLAFLVEADGRRLLYSGDLRMHGRKPGMARKLIRSINERGRLDVLIMEGTNLTRDSWSGLSENELEDFIHKNLLETYGLALAMSSPLHVDRLVSFYKAARRAGRVFVIDPYGALVLRAIHNQTSVPWPAAKNGIRVFYTATFARKRKQLGALFDLFEDARIELKEILAEPKKHMMLFRPNMIAVDFGGKFPPASRCFFSFWRGYLQEGWWAYSLKDQLRDAGVSLIEAHTTGHIVPRDWIYLVHHLNPLIVVPIHTHDPEIYDEYTKKVCIFRDGHIGDVNEIAERRERNERELREREKRPPKDEATIALELEVEQLYEKYQRDCREEEDEI